MPPARRASLIFLWLAPFVSPVLILVYGAGGLKLFAVGGVVLILLMAGAVWILANGLRKSPGNHRAAAMLPGVLLVASLASAAVTVTTGPPPTTSAEWVATHTEQQVRYVGLLTGGLLAFAGFGVLTARLREAGEGLFSVLGFLANSVASTLFVLLTLGALTIFERVARAAIAGSTPTWGEPLLVVIESWLSLYAVLFYLGTFFYAVPLRKVGWLGKIGGATFAGLSTISAVLALVAIATPNQHATLTHGLFVFLIPAVPMIVPYLVGVNLVRRAADPA